MSVCDRNWCVFCSTSLLYSRLCPIIVKHRIPKYTRNRGLGNSSRNSDEAHVSVDVITVPCSVSRYDCELLSDLLRNIVSVRMSSLFSRNKVSSLTIECRPPGHRRPWEEQWRTVSRNYLPGSSCATAKGKKEFLIRKIIRQNDHGMKEGSG